MSHAMPHAPRQRARMARAAGRRVVNVATYAGRGVRRYETIDIGRNARAARVFGAVALLALAFVLAVSFLTGCGAAAPEVRYVDKVVSVPVHVLCAHDAPPVLAPVVSFTCTATACSLAVADAATLADNIERLKSWVAQTWALCAPTEVK